MFARLFLSTVSKEFLLYREALRHALTRKNVEVKIQEDFKHPGQSTLAMLDDYITCCDAVIHLVGDMTGDAPPPRDVTAFLAKYPDLPKTLPPLGEVLDRGESVSYTQWEAWLALYHGRSLLITKGADAAQREATYVKSEDQRAAQAAHLERLAKMERFPAFTFTGADNLVSHILGCLHDILPPPERERTHHRPNNLPYASLGSLFKGREGILDDLHAALTAGHAGAAIAGRALHGLGGIGKTRLAVEYALLFADSYNALLFLRAETPEKLNESLASLVGPEIFDLPEKDAREDAVKIAAALGWLDNHPGWLMILDNVDDSKAVAGVAKLLPKLRGGQVLVTGRVGAFPAGLRKIELTVLSSEASIAFLLERTEDGRIRRADDREQAGRLAQALGGLALGLEQAGAYIVAERIDFGRYLHLWTEKRETVLGWFDRTAMSYDHDAGLAATWATSVEKLTPGGRMLLERLAFLAPEPIPDSLLDVTVEDDAPNYSALAARGNLFAYSLATRAQIETGKAAQDGFVVHRLVQDFSRRAMTEERRDAALREALAWVSAGITGDPGDVRTWPTLDPLAPHALAVAEFGDKAGIAEPTARLFNELGQLFKGKARRAEAERMARRAVSINETRFGPDHPNLTTCLNNLAALLQDANEAEPMMRRALAIDEVSLGAEHPWVAVARANLAALLAQKG